MLVLIVAIAGCNAQSTGSSQGVAFAAEPQSGGGDAEDQAEDGAEPEGDPTVPEHPFPRRIESPPLDGGLAWINVGGPIELEDLRGKFVLLDFWTYCCINCIHILPELKKLEHKYPNELVVIGVHSAKFDTEAETQNITEAVMRYEIEHPVINDADHVVWQAFFCQSWPSLRIIDPEGNLVAAHSGEIDFETLDKFLTDALPYYREQGLLDETPVRFDLAVYQQPETPLRFPGKVLADEAGGRLFISDSNHNRIVISDLAGELLDIVGSGDIGAADGDYASAQFHHPQGMALHELTLYVADTENHLLRKVDLETKQVVTIAGTGKQSRNPWPGTQRGPAGFGLLPDRFVGPPATTALNSPWALWAHGRELFIAMAGPHQIWRMPLDESEIGPYAGNGREDIVDGPLLPAEPYAPGASSFAQPSGLASDGERLFVADSEGSSIRSVPLDGTGNVTTLVGTAHLSRGRLFAFGDKDGPPEKAQLQHVLGVAMYDDTLYIADTYNNKIKAVDPATGNVTTVAGTGEAGSDDDAPTFDEPEGLTAAAGKLFVADTNNHLIRTIDLNDNYRVGTLAIAGLEPPQLESAEPKTRSYPGATRLALESQQLRAVDGNLRLDVQLVLPDDYKLNTLAPMGYQVAPLTDSGIVRREALNNWVRLEPQATEFTVDLPLAEEAGSDQLELGLTFYYCREGAEGLCKVASVVWNLSLEVTPDATNEAVRLEFAAEQQPKETTGPEAPAVESLNR